MQTESPAQPDAALDGSVPQPVSAVAQCSAAAPFAGSASQVAVVLIDQDNCRAACNWPAGRAMRDRICLWAGAARRSRDPAAADAVVVVEVDERRKAPRGEQAEARQRARPLGEGVVAAFSGPRWRADDCIVRDLEWWLGFPGVESVLCVTSDKQVRRRCSEARQRLASRSGGAVDLGRVRFETGEAFALQLPPPPSTPHATSHGDAEAPLALAPAVPGTAGGAIARFAHWIETEQPGPQRTAFEAAHAGSIDRRGSKRKLGSRR